MAKFKSWVVLKSKQRLKHSLNESLNFIYTTYLKQRTFYYNSHDGNSLTNF